MYDYRLFEFNGLIIDCQIKNDISTKFGIWISKFIKPIYESSILFFISIMNYWIQKVNWKVKNIQCWNRIIDFVFWLMCIDHKYVSKSCCYVCYSVRQLNTGTIQQFLTRCVVTCQKAMLINSSHIWHQKYLSKYQYISLVYTSN